MTVLRSQSSQWQSGIRINISSLLVDALSNKLCNPFFVCLLGHLPKQQLVVGKWRQSGFLTQVYGQLREAVFPQTMITSVLVAWRPGLINYSHNMKWAHVPRIMLCYVMFWQFSSFIPLQYLNRQGLPAGGDDDGRHTRRQGPRWVPL